MSRHLVTQRSLPALQLPLLAVVAAGRHLVTQGRDRSLVTRFRGVVEAEAAGWFSLVSSSRDALAAIPVPV